MGKEKILILGACGQIGVELTLALRNIYGVDNVIATDIRNEHELLAGSGPFQVLDAMDGAAITDIIKKNSVTQVYLLAALLSATGEKAPQKAWDINMQSLLQLLDIAVAQKLHKVYWPSSIAVFGSTTPRQSTPQQTIVEPGTVYGISKYAGELWCQYYHKRWGLDVRSLRYPGLISWKSEPGGGTTDYAVDIFYEALKSGRYTSFLSADTYLPMMYMDDAIRGTIELMEAPADKVKSRTAYNFSAMSFSPKELAGVIQEFLPDFEMSYAPDFRQEIANGWPQSIDDSAARNDWGWQPEYDVKLMAETMLKNLRRKLQTA